MEEVLSISGTIEDVIYYNDSNGYAVIEIDFEKQPCVAVGCMAKISEGEKLRLTGKWVVHPEYGRQFKFSDYEVIMPTGEAEMLRYLSSGIVYGVKSATAKKLVEAFGEDTFNVMLTEPMRMSEIKGISKARAEKIAESFREVQVTQSIVLYLQKYGITASMAIKVYNVLGAEAVKVIEENPYVLADRVDGISFETSDNIAGIMGIAKNSPMRIKSGIKYILKSSSYTMGNTCMYKRILTEQSAYILGVTVGEVENVYPDLMMSSEIMPDNVDGEEAFYLYSLYNAEMYVAARLRSIAENAEDGVLTAEEAEDYIKKSEAETGIELAEKQRLAVSRSVMNKCMVLTGGPGTGKTTTINTLIKIFKSLNMKIALAAPTGRAAKRMTQVTGIEAKTIHRLLGANGGGEAAHFSHDEENPLSADVIILDEVSMIDIQLMNYMLRAVKPGARLILSGDSDQLPSVGPGNVLRDIIRSGIIPVVSLDKIFRQAEESYIVVNAHRINHGELPRVNAKGGDFFFNRCSDTHEVAKTITDLYINRLPRAYGYDSMSQIQILSPTKRGMPGTVHLNKCIQDAINPKDERKCEYAYGDTIFRVGDKVMQTKNNYDIVYVRDNADDGTGIFNGDMGIIKEISTVDKVMLIDFDDDKHVEYPFEQLDELDLAYAITVHKSQGSEFPVVVMPVCAMPPMLMCRNLFYTAITRAKELVVLVGTQEAVVTMTINNSHYKRCTGLCDKLSKSMTSKANGFEALKNSKE